MRLWTAARCLAIAANDSSEHPLLLEYTPVAQSRTLALAVSAAACTTASAEAQTQKSLHMHCVLASANDFCPRFAEAL